MKTILIYLFLFFVILPDITAQNLYAKNLKSSDCNGFIVVNGSTNINKFQFNTVVTKQILKEKAKVSISIPVKSFETKNTMMYKDFLQLLKADEYPFIKLTFNTDFNKIDFKEGFQTVPVEITLAGKTLVYKIPILFSKCNENQFTLQGDQSIKLTDFGLNPPKKFQGIVKVNNNIIINFGIVFYSQ